MIKGTIQQEDITLVNIYAPNKRAPKFVKLILMDIKREIGKNILIIRDFNTQLTSMDRFFRPKINKKTVDLNDTLDQMDLIDIFRAFHPNAAEYTYFSSAHETFSRIDYMLGYETSFNKFKIEISSSIFSDSPMKLEINQEQ